MQHVSNQTIAHILNEMAALYEMQEVLRYTIEDCHPFHLKPAT